MFKKRFGHRPRAKRGLETRAHANRAFKRKVTNKVININVKCQQICTQPGDTCPNGGKHILVANAELMGVAGTPATFGFGDAMRIARLEGTLWCRPDYRHTADNAGSCEEAQNILREPTIFRMGLVKSRVQQALGGVPVAVNPLADGVDPFHFADAVDSRFLKTWDHLFASNDQVHCNITTQTQFSDCMPSYIVPPIVAGESPGYIVPAQNCCQPCEGQLAGTVDGATVGVPSWHAFRISYRRPIVLKENDSLDLYFSWEKMRDCNTPERTIQPPLQWLGHVFMTVEK